MTSLRTPFVLTVSTLTALACGAQVQFEGGDSTSTSGGGGETSTSSNSSSSSSSSSNNTSSSSGAGGNGADCPALPPSSWDECSLTTSQSCTYDLDCQSGSVTLTFACIQPEGFGWTVLEQDCALPYDSCPGTELYCSQQWWMPQGTNPPAPCPEIPPADASECFAGGFGGVHEACGYRCDDGTGWQVARCTGWENSPDFTGAWEYDEGCEP